MLEIGQESIRVKTTVVSNLIFMFDYRRKGLKISKEEIAMTGISHRLVWENTLL